MTFPIDFWTHPKVSRLSDAAFRAFVESNGHSRMRESDGVIEAEDAEFMWPTEALSELTRSHPTRPLLLRSGGTYVLRDYAEHQFTKADRDALSKKRAEAGAKGGKAKANAKQELSKAQQTEAESESGTGITTYVQESSHVSDRASEDGLTKEQSEELTRGTLRGGFGIDPDRLLKHIRQRVDRDVDIATAMNVVTWLLDKGKDVKNPQAYVLGSITRSWAEVQQYIDTRA